VDDRALVRAFVRDGARDGEGAALRIEADCLVLDRWWPVAFRVAPHAFGLRDDPPPVPTTALDDVAGELAALGLHAVGTDPPLLHVITYAEIAFGLVSWTMWSTDPAAAEAALAARAGQDSSFSSFPPP
jgi:hypothetical protein